MYKYRIQMMTRKILHRDSPIRTQKNDFDKAIKKKEKDTSQHVSLYVFSTFYHFNVNINIY